MHLRDLEDPVPGPKQLLVRIEAVGVNFIDIYLRRGLYKVASYPYVPGLEAAGTVLALGEGVTEFRVGDRVAACNIVGAYAEKALVAADRAVPVPPAIDLEAAAAVLLQGMTAHYLVESTFPLAPGQRCLVHAAAGGVGLLLCQLARRRGARVIATVSSEEKAKLARAAGAEAVIDYSSQDFAQEVARWTDGAGLEVVYDSVGRSTFDASLRCLAPRGTLVLYGQSSGPVPPVDPQVLAHGGSLYLTRPVLGHYTQTRDELLGRARDLFSWMAARELEVKIGRSLPLAEAARAHELLESRATVGKVLLLP
ncbi:MAG: quinone oxidoreductase [Candidatus Eisenbacteria bacterium]